MASELIEVLRHLLGDPAEVAPIASIDEWWARHRQVAEPYATPVARAFAGGFAADRLGYAFASGYVEALASLVPSLAGVRAALCATEGGAAHPRAIETELEEVEGRYRITGTKSFVTLADFAEELLVVARVGADDHGRNRLKVVRLPRDRDGLHIRPSEPLPMVPEIPHATLVLEGARVERDEVLEGDGYEEYLKPFRTTEDLHVHAALVGWLIQVGRRSGWRRADIEDLAEVAAALFSLALTEPLDAAVHVTLGGVLRRVRAIAEGLDWDSVDDETRARFERDRPLLGVAQRARDARLDTAWARLGRLSLPG